MKTLTRKSTVQMLNKVPEVTIYFWIIKIMATTVGETAPDFLSFNLHFGLTGTSVVLGATLVTFLFMQVHAGSVQKICAVAILGDCRSNQHRRNAHYRQFGR